MAIFSVGNRPLPDTKINMHAQSISIMCMGRFTLWAIVANFGQDENDEKDENVVGLR